MSAVTACNRFSKRYPKAVAPYENWLLEGNCNPNDVKSENPDGESTHYKVQPPIELGHGPERGWMSLILDFIEHESGTAHFHRAQVAFGFVSKELGEKVRDLLWQHQTQMSAPFRYFTFEREGQVCFGLEYSFIAEGVTEEYKIILLDELLRHSREIFKELETDHGMRPFFPPETPRKAAA